MRLLIVTQKVDDSDSVLGFFVDWIKEFQRYADDVTVICLSSGHYQFSPKIDVYSLGKEKGVSRFRYILNFYRYAWKTRKQYDTVFVHMNQEYVILAGLLWRLLGKKVMMWRNHPYGTWLTNVAVAFAHKTFATSPQAYLARFKKTELMPVGIDMNFFAPRPHMERAKNSILMLSRIAPIKKQDMLVEALSIVKKDGYTCTAALVGDTLPRDISFLETLHKKVKDESLGDVVSFYPGVPFTGTADCYSKYELFVNATPSGSMDKTIFEAMSSGMFVVTSNKAVIGKIPDECVFEEGSSESLAKAIERFLSMPTARRNEIIHACRAYVIRDHSLFKLVTTIVKEN